MTTRISITNEGPLDVQVTECEPGAPGNSPYKTILKSEQTLGTYIWKEKAIVIEEKFE